MIIFTIAVLFYILEKAQCENADRVTIGFIHGTNLTNDLGAFGSSYDDNYYPPNRARFALCRYNDEEIFIHGGGRKVPPLLYVSNDLWMYNQITNQFKKVAGSEGNSIWSDHGTKGIWGFNNLLGARRGHECVVLKSNDDSQHDRIIFLAGEGADDGSGIGHLNDIWEYDISTKGFTWVSGENTLNSLGSYGTSYSVNNSFPGHKDSSVHQVSDDELMIFFGYIPYSHTYSCEQWLYNITSNELKFHGGKQFPTCTISDYGVGPSPEWQSDAYPGARSRQASWVIDDEIYFFGGYGVTYNATGALKIHGIDELWVYSYERDKWKFLSGRGLGGIIPQYNTEIDTYTDSSVFMGARYESVILPLVEDNGIVVLGGRGVTQVPSWGDFNDIWIFNLTTYLWKFVGGDIATEIPMKVGEKGEMDNSYNYGSRRAHKAIINDTSIIIFFGESDGEKFNSVLKIDGIITKSIHPDDEDDDTDDDIDDDTDDDENDDIDDLDDDTDDENDDLIIPIYQRSWFLGAVIGGSVGLLAILLCLTIIIVFLIICLWKGKPFLKKIHMVLTTKNAEMILEEHNAENKAEKGAAHLKINKKLFVLNYEDITLIREIGNGGSGSTVYQANWKNKIVAFKVFKVKLLDHQSVFDEFEKEVEIMSSISHPNILQFFGATLKNPRVGIVMEYCSNGTLNDVIEKHAPNDMLFRIRVLVEVSDAMEHLHGLGVWHRDLKCQNVLLNDSYTSKLIDFGLSKIVDKGSKSGNTKQVGTSVYMAPEVTTGYNYDHKMDVFSFGIMMWELYYENFEPYGKVKTNIELKVSQRPSFRPITDSSDFPDELKKFHMLMIRCWDHSADMRPEFKDVNKTLSAIQLNYSRLHRGKMKPIKGQEENFEDYKRYSSMKSLQDDRNDEMYPGREVQSMVFPHKGTIQPPPRGIRRGLPKRPPSVNRMAPNIPGRELKSSSGRRPPPRRGRDKYPQSMQGRRPPPRKY